MSFAPSRHFHQNVAGNFGHCGAAKGNRAIAPFFVGLAVQALRVAIANLSRAEKDIPGVSLDAIEHCRKALEPLEAAYPGNPRRGFGG